MEEHLERSDGAGSADRFAWLRAFHYPRYDELPEEPVFLKDIVAGINELAVGFPPAMHNYRDFTVPMARNYIQQGLTPPPIGKRYGRDHWCRLYLASTLKLAYSASDVVRMCLYLLPDDDIPGGNDALALEMETAFKRVMDDPFAQSGLNDDRARVRRYVCDTLSYKMASLALIPDDPAADADDAVDVSATGGAESAAAGSAAAGAERIQS